VSIISPHVPTDRGCQLSILLSDGLDSKEAEEKLANEGVVVDARSQVIRVAPTPLYNSFTDVFQFVQILHKILTHPAHL